jgi:hypothetical protein
MMKYHDYLRSDVVTQCPKTEPGGAPDPRSAGDLAESAIDVLSRTPLDEMAQHDLETMRSAHEKRVRVISEALEKRDRSSRSPRTSPRKSTAKKASISSVRSQPRA